jgi:proline iminopeptidase
VPTVELGGGRRASYEVIGDGPPAMMLPGGPGLACAYMRSTAELFADVWQSYLVDPHGSGDSSPPSSPDDYSPEGHARFYDEVRSALGLEAVTVVGHSFGATTALTYAALYPESTRGASTPSRPASHRPVCGRAESNRHGPKPTRV